MGGSFTRAHRWASVLACTVLITVGDAPVEPLAAQAPAIEPALLDAYEWRSIGPPRGGRSIAASGVRGRPMEAYFGATGGGLWKTTDAGHTWKPVTDGQVGSSSVGAVAVSESNPDIVFIGMGESCIRNNILPGDGVYKSTDAGKTWTSVGFGSSDAISRVRIHPTNPDIVFVASFGRYGVPSDERGVFKSTDGGATWKKVLFRDDKTGAADLDIDPNNPQVVYATLWEAYRIEYQMSSGGPGSGIFKSTDGGETWAEITRNPGLPSGVVGRVGIAVSRADSKRVYALVENEQGGLYVSDDAGASWKLVNDDRRVRQRAFYYTHVHADPNDRDTVYLLNTSAFRSTDGGKTLTSVGNGTHGDHHDLWIDPDDSDHVVIANDGGGAISYNVASRERTWSDEDFPTAQFYHVATTAHLPFHVCGAQQDNSTICVPSDTGLSGGFGRIPPVAPYQAGGGEPGYIAPDPTNPDVFFSGANNGTFLTRLDRRTGALKEVGAYPRFFSGEPSSAVKERWQWTYPIIFSYVDPTILYTSSQRVWKSTDGGDHWEAISGDLSRHDPETMGMSGGPITHDMNSPEIYGTVFSLAPGKTDVGVIWAGSDDGLVHVTRDGGKSWANVTPPGMPDFGRVSQIDGSQFDSATAYVAVKKMLLGDVSPYIFRTQDFGKTWTMIVDGIEPNDYVHAVREDPTRKGLLYAGTAHGFYVSFDDGAHWTALEKGLPDTPVTDVWVEDNDLAIATHGRSFYVLDNISTLRQVGTSSTAGVRLFKPYGAIRGARAARIDYWLKAQPESLLLEIRDSEGAVVRSYPGTPPKKEEGKKGEEEESPRRGPVTSAPMTEGLNRFTWDLMSEPVVSFPGMILWGATTNGPMVLPGTYEVRLTVDGETQSQPLLVEQHPERPVSMADLQAQYDLASRIRDKVNESNNLVIRIRRIKEQLEHRTSNTDAAEAKELATELAASLSEVEENVYQVRNRSNQDPLNFPIKINNRFASLLRVVNTGEGRPTSNAEPIFEDIVAELKVQTDRFDRVLNTELATFNLMMERMKMPPIDPK